MTNGFVSQATIRPVKMYLCRGCELMLNKEHAKSTTRKGKNGQIPTNGLQKKQIVGKIEKRYF